MDKKYTVEERFADLTVEEYMRGYRDVPLFMECCRSCPNYGHSWGCPPFEFDTEEILSRYEYVRLRATTITFAEKGLPADRAGRLILPERIRIERELLEMEPAHDGRSFAFVGKCLYCDKCTRPEGGACRHPELVRPSLEAFGFDIGKTLSEIFGRRLVWGSGGRLPDYLTLVSALMHNDGALYRSGGK